jgi:2-dehydropantoate 2-reductase
LSCVGFRWRLTRSRIRRSHKSFGSVLRAPFGAFQRDAHAMALMISAAEEVLALAGAIGIGLERSDSDEMLRIVDSVDPQAKTLMFQDVEAGRATEVDLFAGTVLAMGAKCSIATPVNKTLFHLIRAIEDAYPRNA